MCVVGQKKKERQWGTWVVEKKKMKRKKEMGSRVYVYGGKKWGVEKKKNLNWFYLYVHFVWCKV